MNYIQAHTHR